MLIEAEELVRLMDDHYDSQYGVIKGHEVRESLRQRGIATEDVVESLLRFCKNNLYCGSQYVYTAIRMLQYFAQMGELTEGQAEKLLGLAKNEHFVVGIFGDGECYRVVDALSHSRQKYAEVLVGFATGLFSSRDHFDWRWLVFYTFGALWARNLEFSVTPEFVSSLEMEIPNEKDELRRQSIREVLDYLRLRCAV